MTRFVQMLLSGIFFTFILDFFFFLGIKLNYIDPLAKEVGNFVYFNVLFVDHQNLPLFLLLSLATGWLITYTKPKIWLLVTAFLFVLSLTMLLPSIGKEVAQMLFLKQDVTLHSKKFTFKGDIYYIGREKILFYDKELNKFIQLKKSEIKEKDL